MRRKISTLLEEGLFRKAKMESARQGKQFSEIVGEALQTYLKTASGPVAGAVEQTWATLPARKGQLKRVLADEEGLFET